MSVRTSRQLLAALALMVGVGSAQAAAINLVGYGELNPAQTLEFGGSGVLDGIQTFGAAKFGERFSGQLLGSDGDFDTLGGSPSKPLTLLAGAAGQNLVYSNAGLAGMGKAGVDVNGNPLANAVGEGAISVLFDGDQSEVGFQVLGGSNGSKLVLDFFRFDGSLIQSITLTDLFGQVALFGFQRDGGVKDIAGVSIWNSDVGGLAIDNLAFDVTTVRDPGDPTPVPAPGVLLLAGLALVAAGSARRRG